MKPRVLFLTASAQLRGANRTLLEEIACGLKDSLDCCIACTPGKGPFAEAARRTGAPVFEADQPWWVTAGGVEHWLLCMSRMPQAVAEAERLVRQEQINVVCSCAGVSPVGALAAARQSKPHVWRIQEAYTLEATRLASPAGQPALAAAFCEMSARVVVTCRAIMERELASHAPPGRVVLVPPGVDCRPYADIGPASDRRGILAVGATTPEKGLDDLIAAAGLLRDRGVDFRVDVLGGFYSAAYKERILADLSRRGLSERFLMHGHQEDLRPWLERCAVVCSASHAESFGRTLVEAGAAGRPVVATRCYGPEDIVVDGETGRLVPVADPASLAGALADALADPDRGRAMGLAGRGRAVERFDAAVTAKSMAGVLQDVIGEGPPRPAAGMADMLLTVLEHGGPRILLGRKWRAYAWLANLMGRRT